MGWWLAARRPCTCRGQPVVLTAYVDDYTLEHNFDHGTWGYLSMADKAHMAATNGANLNRRLGKVGLPVADDKKKVVASNRAVADKVASLMGGGCKAVDATPVLGVDYAGGRATHFTSMRKRTAKAVGKGQRIRWTEKFGA